MIRRRGRRSYKSRIPRQGNFHLALPSMLKLRLTAQDSNVHGLGLGGWGYFDATANQYKTSNASTAVAQSQPLGLAPTFCMTFFDLSRPFAELHRPPDSRGIVPQESSIRSASQFAAAAAAPDTYFASAPAYLLTSYHMPGFVSNDSRVGTDSTQQVISKPDVLPGQLGSFANLFKYAVVERVDFVFKYTNLGTGPLYGASDSSASSSVSLAGSNLLHTCMPLPRSQLEVLKRDWKASNRHSNSNAVHFSEFPGCTTIITAQDGTKETGFVRKSFDLAQITGDTVRKESWAYSTDEALPQWVWPNPPDTEPQLCMFATSPLIDSRLASAGYPETLTAGNVLLRYNEHIQVHYHITFWQPKTPSLTVNL